MYLGIYTREEKMCPQDAVFLRDSLESVVSSERLFGKRSFSTASSDCIAVAFRFNRRQLRLRRRLKLYLPERQTVLPGVRCRQTGCYIVRARNLRSAG